MTPRDFVKSIGQRINTLIVDLQKQALCPQCGKYNLTVEVKAKTILVVTCQTPIGIDPLDSQLLYCPFSEIIDKVDIAQAPFNFSFSADKQIKPPVKQKTKSRPTTTARKRPVRRKVTE